MALDGLVLRCRALVCSSSPAILLLRDGRAHAAFYVWPSPDMMLLAQTAACGSATLAKRTHRHGLPPIESLARCPVLLCPVCVYASRTAGHAVATSHNAESIFRRFTARSI